MSELKTALKLLIIVTLDLEDIEVSDIKDNEALFIDGLGLDSIDALELGFAIKKVYDVKLMLIQSKLSSISHQLMH